MRRILLVVLALASMSAQPASRRARNVILFLADAGGIPTLHAASVHGHGAAGRLFVQRMPHIGLSDTSTAAEVVTDSAAGMTAIVTGVRTRNAVISQSADAVPGSTTEGEPLKSILEYAEEHGLATGFVTNDAITGATPAALYAKVNDRSKTASIFLQLFEPRAGDGVDVAIGAGRGQIRDALQPSGRDAADVARGAGREILANLADVPSDARRAIVLLDREDFELASAVTTAIRVLSRSSRGYFLMVECDVHTDRLRIGLDRMVGFDRVIEDTVAAAGANTLVMFTADHSFALRTHDGRLGQPLLADVPAETAPPPTTGSQRYANVWVDDSHTGEEVLVAAQGPGAERVHGYLANTDLFRIMMNAYGWAPSRPAIGRVPQR